MKGVALLGLVIDARGMWFAGVGGSMRVSSEERRTFVLCPFHTYPSTRVTQVKREPRKIHYEGSIILLAFEFAAATVPVFLLTALT